MLKEIFQVMIAVIMIIGSLVITTMSYGIEFLPVMLGLMFIGGMFGLVAQFQIYLS